MKNFKVQYRTPNKTISTATVSAKSAAEARAKFRQGHPTYEILEVYEA